MAVAYGSIQTNTAASGNLTITKPTGLAAGDLMVAVLNTEDSGDAWTASGWTFLDSEVDSTARATTVLFRVADSADASAADFTFTNPGNECAGALLRITGTSFSNINNFVYTSSGTTGSANPSFSGITTRIDGDLLIQAWVAPENALVTFSGYAVATNDPTWTERADFQYAGAEDMSMAIATATYTTAGATGNFTVTISSATRSFGFLMAISETASTTQTPDVLNVASSVIDPTMTGSANTSPAVIDIVSTVQSPTVSTGAMDYQNATKTTETFTPTTKNTETFTPTTKNTETWTGTTKN